MDGGGYVRVKVLPGSFYILLTFFLILLNLEKSRAPIVSVASGQFGIWGGGEGEKCKYLLPEHDVLERELTRQEQLEVLKSQFIGQHLADIRQFLKAYIDK